MKPSSQHIGLYRSFRKEIDEKATELSVVHERYMQCRRGCDGCCEDFNIFPVEFFTIAEDLHGRYPEHTAGRCVFLSSGVCTLYAYRPLICRTHGLPLVRMNDEGEWEFSTCDRNFRDAGAALFTEDNVLFEDVMNSRLFLLNREFIHASEGNIYGETDKIALKNLKKNYISELLNEK